MDKRFVLLLLLPFSAFALDGRVVAITDGDTLTLLNAQHQQHKIRLSGIDAPEKAQSFGQRSRCNLAAMVFGKDVTAECGKTDRYRRDVCKIILNGTDEL